MGRLAFALLLGSLVVVSCAYSASRANAGVEGKASQVSGAVPPSQLGSGVASASTCLNGNSMQRSCSGSPAGITYATTAQNWSQTIASSKQNLTGCPSKTSCATQTVTLTPCPIGVDTTSGVGYQVYISDGSAEAVSVTGGTCTSGAASGTITFFPFSNHTAYTIESASSGIQETINQACGAGASPTYYNVQCNVTVPANGGPVTGYSFPLNTYNVYGTIFLHSSQSVLSGYGVSLNCLGRGACIQVGTLTNSSAYTSPTVRGFSFRTPVDRETVPAYEGVNITNTVRTSNVVTITTATAHGFRPGDMVTKLFTDNSAYWGDSVVTTVPTSTTFTYSRTGADIASQATPGVVALAYVAILDNAQGTHFTDLQYDFLGAAGRFNNFFDFWDDENATIEHFNNTAISLGRNTNWTGSFVYSTGNENIPIAPVITMRDSTITANNSNCVDVSNSNGVYIENTVCQASGLWQFRVSNDTGGLHGGGSLKNIYSESNVTLNPLSPARSPFPGLGIAGLIAGRSASSSTFDVRGEGSLVGAGGAFPTGGSGSTPYSYFIVANDTTAGTQTSPMQILDWLSTGSDSIPVRWPRVASGADVITYDVIRMTTPSGTGIYPYAGGCPGGSGGTCGSVAHNLSQTTACSGTLICTYTDSGSSTTTAYTIETGNYDGLLAFWPGAIVTVDHSVSVDTEQYPSVGVGLSGGVIQTAQLCTVDGQATPGGYTSCLASRGDMPNETATILGDRGLFGSTPTMGKGRLNFSGEPFNSQAYFTAHHIITLVDSEPALTRATTGYQPPANVNDVFIGVDNAPGTAGYTTSQLAFGSPVSISNYIGNTGNNKSWLERLTSKQKSFAVPVRISEGNSFTLGDGSPLSQMKIYSVNNMPASHVPPQSCVDIVGKAKGLTKSDQITSINPPGRLGNLSLNAYPEDEGAIVLHFCNPSGSEVITPPGAYSFLAVR